MIPAKPPTKDKPAQRSQVLTSPVLHLQHFLGADSTQQPPENPAGWGVKTPVPSHHSPAGCMLEDTATNQPGFHLVKSPGSAVQAVGPIVEEELIVLPGHREPPLRNPVGNAPHDGTEEGMLPRVTCPESAWLNRGMGQDGWPPERCLCFPLVLNR